ncbi:MAG: hypothetical protein J6Y01_10695, partial [Spirochaetales bacterium]|nr:hypothetical protein [Spirochaetales bacterium]
MKHVKYIILVIIAVMMMTSCIYDQIMALSTEQSGTAQTNNDSGNNGGNISGGENDSNKIKTLQAVIDDPNIKDGSEIDLSNYLDITDYKATINKSVTIKNGSIHGEALTIRKEGVVLSNVQQVSVNTNSSMKISSSMLKN